MRPPSQNCVRMYCRHRCHQHLVAEHVLLRFFRPGTGNMSGDRGVRQNLRRLLHLSRGHREGTLWRRPRVRPQSYATVVCREVDRQVQDWPIGSSAARDIPAGQHRSPWHHEDGRLLRGRTVRSHRHGEVHWRRALRQDRRQHIFPWLPLGTQDGCHHQVSVGGGGLPPRQRSGPSRHQAGEHPVRIRGRKGHQAHRLWSVATTREGRGSHEQLRGHCVLHVT
mmetsp:Transcript_9688/g.21024  ORF Transcript_9688/g.21024 Transcript_9688/m.21024 type:complete len:223 (+) Transcript_9688:256-924(+)